MNGDTNGNGNGNNKLIWYILGLFGSLIGIIILVGINKIGSIDDRLRETEVRVAALTENMVQQKEGTSLARTTQLDAVTKFAELNAKISSTELSIKLLNDRYTTMSERLLAINQRLDKVPLNHTELK
jgi:hypothetical protein